jgi:hypothetical protein
LAVVALKAVSLYLILPYALSDPVSKNTLALFSAISLTER